MNEDVASGARGRPNRHTRPPVREDMTQDLRQIRQMLEQPADPWTSSAPVTEPPSSQLPFPDRSYIPPGVTARVTTSRPYHQSKTTNGSMGPPLRPLQQQRQVTVPLSMHSQEDIRTIGLTSSPPGAQSGTAIGSASLHHTASGETSTVDHTMSASNDLITPGSQDGPPRQLLLLGKRTRADTLTGSSPNRHQTFGTVADDSIGDHLMFSPLETGREQSRGTTLAGSSIGYLLPPATQVNDSIADHLKFSSLQQRSDDVSQNTRSPNTDSMPDDQSADLEDDFIAHYGLEGRILIPLDPDEFVDADLDEVYAMTGQSTGPGKNAPFANTLGHNFTQTFQPTAMKNRKELADALSEAFRGGRQTLAKRALIDESQLVSLRGIEEEPMISKAYDVLLQMDDDLINGLIRGDLAQQDIAGSGRVHEILQKNFERSKEVEQPVIYQLAFVQVDDGKPPTVGDMQALLKDLSHYCREPSTDKIRREARNRFANRVDRLFGEEQDKPTKEQSQSGVRRYLSNSTQDLPTQVRRKTVNTYAKHTAERVHNLEVDKIDRLDAPQSYIGIAKDGPLARWAAHSGHVHSCKIMNLMEALAKKRFPGKYKIHKMVVHLVADYKQAGMSEILVTRLAQGFMVNASGFAHYPAGISCNVGKKSKEWRAFWEYMEKYSPYQANHRAENHRTEEEDLGWGISGTQSNIGRLRDL